MGQIDHHRVPVGHIGALAPKSDWYRVWFADHVLFSNPRHATADLAFYDLLKTAYAGGL